MLGELLGILADRVGRLRDAASGGLDPDGMAELSEAFEALRSYASAVSFLADAGSGPFGPVDGEASTPTRDAALPTTRPPETESRGDASTSDEHHAPAIDRASARIPAPPSDSTDRPTPADAEAPATGLGRRLEPNGGSPDPVAERDYPPFRDQVTGLHSREGFDTVAGGELKRCRRYGRVFSLVLLQLPSANRDGLRRAANAVRAATRESDLAGRHVDRTLAIALPETPPNEARIVAERVIDHCEGVGSWDASSRVGLVTHPAHGETLNHLVDAARAQLTLPARHVLAELDRGSWPG